MFLARPVTSADPRTFGRGPAKDVECGYEPAAAGRDVRLFLTTFAAGFVFISVFLA
jgi:hypothetical protein